MNWFMIANWAIMIFGGIYAYLILYDVVDPFKGDEAKKALWHKKFDKLIKFCAPMMIFGGAFLIITEFLGW